MGVSVVIGSSVTALVASVVEFATYCYRHGQTPVLFSRRLAFWMFMVVGTAIGPAASSTILALTDETAPAGILSGVVFGVVTAMSGSFVLRVPIPEFRSRPLPGNTDSPPIARLFKGRPWHLLSTRLIALATRDEHDARRRDRQRRSRRLTWGLTVEQYSQMLTHLQRVLEGDSGTVIEEVPSGAVKRVIGASRRRVQRSQNQEDADATLAALQRVFDQPIVPFECARLMHDLEQFYSRGHVDDAIQGALRVLGVKLRMKDKLSRRLGFSARSATGAPALRRPDAD